MESAERSEAEGDGHELEGQSKRGLPSSLTAKVAVIKQLAQQLEDEIASVDRETAGGLGNDITQKEMNFVHPLPAVSHPGDISTSDISADCVRTLQLMHHFCTSTYKSLSLDSATAEAWKTSVPAVAFSHVGGPHSDRGHN